MPRKPAKIKIAISSEPSVSLRKYLFQNILKNRFLHQNLPKSIKKFRLGKSDFVEITDLIEFQEIAEEAFPDRKFEIAYRLAILIIENFNKNPQKISEITAQLEKKQQLKESGIWYDEATINQQIIDNLNGN